MRIIGGRFKGRSLAAPTTRAIRPTSDRLREMIFNILDHAYDSPVAGVRVIDLFAGTGALGFEALSRGAAHALFVDQGAEARALLRANIETFGVAGIARVFRRDATRLGLSAGDRFGLAFLDPPYGHGLAEAALAGLHAGGWLDPLSLCVIEEADKAALVIPSGFTPVDRRVQGDTAVLFCRYQPDLNGRPEGRSPP